MLCRTLNSKEGFTESAFFFFSFWRLFIHIHSRGELSGKLYQRQAISKALFFVVVALSFVPPPTCATRCTFGSCMSADVLYSLASVYTASFWTLPLFFFFFRVCLAKDDVINRSKRNTEASV